MVAYVKKNWLDAVTAVGPTASEDLAGFTRFALQASATGSPTSAAVALEGSVDGATWFTLLNADGAPSQAHEAWTSLTEARFARYVRLNLTQLLNGTSPTVSASIIALASD